MKFDSKRNKVFLTDGIVVKQFACEKSASFEMEQLQRLRVAGVLVPSVLFCEGFELGLEYVSGETLPDFIERLERLQCERQASSMPYPAVLSELEAAAAAIICWLSDFYRAVDSEKTGEIRGDVNGRNFLLDGACCIGVDFEERCFGTREQDIGRLVAFVITYTPQGTEVKAEFARMLMQNAVQILGVDATEVERQRDLELKAIIDRRARLKI